MEVNTTITLYELLAFLLATVSSVVVGWYNNKNRVSKLEWELNELRKDHSELKGEQDNTKQMLGEIKDILQEIRLEMKDKVDWKAMKKSQ